MKRCRSLIVSLAVAACLVPAVGSASYIVVWSGDIYFPVDGIPQSYIGDFDGDNRLEMVGREGTATVIVDAMTGVNEYHGGAYSLASSYSVVDLDNDGTPEIVGQLSNGSFVIDWGIAANSNQGQNLDGPESFGSHPNPFGANTSINFTLPSEGLVDVSVYDVAGRQVRQLVDRILPSGQHIIEWNGRDDAGRQLSAGTYFYEIMTDGRSLGKAKSIRLN